MILLAFGDRVAGCILLALNGLMACAANDIATIPGHSSLTVVIAGVSVLCAIVGLDFLCKAPVLTLLARKRSETNRS